MKILATKLGLAAEASEEAIAAAVEAVLNRATTAETKLTALQGEHDTLKNRAAELETEQIAGLLDARGIKDEAKRNTLTPVLAGLKNREARVQLLDTMGLSPKKEAEPAPRPLTNRAEARTPEGGSSAAAADPQHAKKQANAVQAIQNRERCDFQTAWNLAKAEKPELFS